jgi:aldose 1-epimerase
MKITTQPFGEAQLFTLENDRGMRVSITTYGGRIVSLFAPDRAGKFEDVTLGFDALDGYLGRNPFFGALVGRFANRIGDSAFKLNGREYAITPTEGKNSLHGGKLGFDKRIWNARVDDGQWTMDDTSAPSIVNGLSSLVLTYFSADGEEGYPGNMLVTVRYTLDNANALTIDYDAVSDADTICSLTNHAYFNLAGAGNGDVLGHELTLDANAITVVRPDSIPTGEMRPVAGTPFKLAAGYDHNFALNNAGHFARIGELYEPHSGRRMEVFTDAPGVQLYTGNKIGAGYAITGKGGKTYGQFAGLCLETQHFPDAINQPSFPSPILRAGDRYAQKTMWKFDAI